MHTKQRDQMSKLTSAQAYALQIKSDRRAAALERQNTVVREDNVRIATVLNKGNVASTRVVTSRKNSPKERWSPSEMDFAIELYLKQFNKAQNSLDSLRVIQLFSQKFPKRGDKGVNMLLCQIKGLDTWYPAKGLKDTSAMLINKLYAVDPVRFPIGATNEQKAFDALDSLLKDIQG
jgi:hypothetical protein